MDSECVKYCGNIVPKEGFRAFIYGAEGKQKLVNSWMEYEAHIATGVWYSLKDEVPAQDVRDDVKPKKKG